MYCWSPCLKMTQWAHDVKWMSNGLQFMISMDVSIDDPEWKIKRYQMLDIKCISNDWHQMYIKFLISNDVSIHNPEWNLKRYQMLHVDIICIITNYEFYLLLLYLAHCCTYNINVMLFLLCILLSVVCIHYVVVTSNI